MCVKHLLNVSNPIFSQWLLGFGGGKENDPIFYYNINNSTFT